MQKFDNFVASLRNLETVQGQEPPYSPIVKAGIINLFEITFELSWKTIKDILEDNGYLHESSGSARTILRAAYAAKMIENEDAWIELLDLRNLLSHTYDDKKSEEAVDKIKKDFIPLFAALEKELRDNWL